MFSLRQAMGALAVLAAPFTLAAPTAKSAYIIPDIAISKLAVYQPVDNSSNSTQDTTISFVVQYGNATTLCSGEWGTNETYPTGGYTACANTTFGWNFEDGSFTSVSQFTLQLEYEYEDDSVGEAPYNRVVEFARASVNSTQLACTTQNGGQSCQQRTEGSIEAPIYATIAK